MDLFKVEESHQLCDQTTLKAAAADGGASSSMWWVQLKRRCADNQDNAETHQSLSSEIDWQSLRVDDGTNINDKRQANDC